MKTLSIYATTAIILLAAITTIVLSADLSWEVEKVNRDTSLKTLYILNRTTFWEYFFATDKYKREEGKRFHFEMSDVHMIDGEGPLNTNANVYAFIYTNGGQWQDHSILKYDLPVIMNNHNENTLWQKKGFMYQIWWPNRYTSVTAYAFAKCDTDYAKYRSKYDVYAEVPKKYNPMNIIHKRPAKVV